MSQPLRFVPGFSVDAARGLRRGRSKAFGLRAPGQAWVRRMQRKTTKLKLHEGTQRVKGPTGEGVPPAGSEFCAAVDQHTGNRGREA